MTRFGLPLLAKELTEIAARRRTYVTRVVYALLLFGFFAGMNESVFRRAAESALNAMGTGREMFLTLMVLQAFGIYLFLPAMMAGQITQEKERDSLVLLFLTELGPWQILLQKYASGLIAILSFLLIGMPLAALAYSFGGISAQMLCAGVWALLLTCLQVAAFALLCSARARTTVGAFLGTYVGGIVIFFGLVFGGSAIDHFWTAVPSRSFERFGFSVFPASLFEVIYDSQNLDLSTVFVRGLPSLGATSFFLLLARFYFVRRAFAPASNTLLILFSRIDVWMHRGNRLFGNLSIRTRDRSLPEDDPIAWRESTRKSLGRPHYLARVLIGLEIPTVALGFAAVVNEHGSENYGLSMLAAVLGSLAALSLSAFAANAFVSERVNQTLDVLLTTPLTARDIVLQKARTLTRLTWVLAAPVMTVFALECWAEERWAYGHRADAALYLGCSVLTLAVYLPLILWLSLWIGLKMRTRFRAIVTALAVIVGWCVSPAILAEITHARSEDWWNAPLAFACPIFVPAANEISQFGNLNIGPHWLAVAINFALYSAILFMVRRRCLDRADTYLRG